MSTLVYSGSWRETVLLGPGDDVPYYRVARVRQLVTDYLSQYPRESSWAEDEARLRSELFDEQANCTTLRQRLLGLHPLSTPSTVVCSCTLFDTIAVALRPHGLEPAWYRLFPLDDTAPEAVQEAVEEAVEEPVEEPVEAAAARAFRFASRSGGRSGGRSGDRPGDRPGGRPGSQVVHRVRHCYVCSREIVNTSRSIATCRKAHRGTVPEFVYMCSVTCWNSFSFGSSRR